MDRRTFLRRLGFGAAGVVLAPTLAPGVLAAPEEAPPDEAMTSSTSAKLDASAESYDVRITRAWGKRKVVKEFNAALGSSHRVFEHHTGSYDVWTRAVFKGGLKTEWVKTPYGPFSVADGTFTVVIPSE